MPKFNFGSLKKVEEVKGECIPSVKIVAIKTPKVRRKIKLKPLNAPNATKFINIFKTEPISILVTNDKLRNLVYSLTETTCRENSLTCAFILKSIAEIILNSEKNKKEK